MDRKGERWRLTQQETDRDGETNGWRGREAEMEGENAKSSQILMRGVN